MREERDRLKDYTVTKRKEDQVLKRLEKVLARKKLPDNKDEMCD